jgi:tetratricopeptide (TPR) repeat protein
MKRLLALVAVPVLAVCGGPDVSKLDVPQAPEEQVKYGLQLHLDGQYAEAAAVFEIAAPRVPIAVSFEARSVSEMGDHEEALRLAREGAEHPGLAESPVAPFIRGLAAERAGQSEEAEKAYLAALERAPNWASALNNLAGIHYDRGELWQARDLFMQGLRHSCGDAGIRSIIIANISELEVLEGRMDRAEQLARRAVEIAPDEAGTRLWLAVVLGLRGHAAEAVAEANAGLDLDPHGATRRAVKWLHPEQETYFAGLLHEAEGNDWSARVEYEKLAALEHEGLKATAYAGVAAAHLSRVGERLAAVGP